MISQFYESLDQVFHDEPIISKAENKRMNDEDKFQCTECGEECGLIEEVFDYAGTHCTGGSGGVHRTGNLTSSCCDTEYLIIQCL
jgi:hypothetical protein